MFQLASVYTVCSVCWAMFCSVYIESIDSSKFHDNPLNPQLPSPYVTEDETGAVRCHLTKVTQLVCSDGKMESRKTDSS